jgi:purine-cytosine permease-like protein
VRHNLSEESIKDKSDRLKDFLPVTLFIALTFLLEAFGLNKATNLVISVLVSLFTFGVLSAMLREKHGDLPQFKPLQRKIGYLSVTFVIIVGIAILHWYQILHVNIRWLLFFLFLIVYFIILFRSVKTLNEIKSKLPSGSKNKKK